MKKTKDKKQSEKELQKQIINWLNLQGFFAWCNNTGAVFSEYKGRKRMIKFGLKGSSDILGIIPGGLFLAIEVKVKYAKPTIDQDMFLNLITEKGGVAMWVSSLDEVIEKLKDYLR